MASIRLFSVSFCFTIMNNYNEIKDNITLTTVSCKVNFLQIKDKLPQCVVSCGRVEYFCSKPKRFSLNT